MFLYDKTGSGERCSGQLGQLGTMCLRHGPMSCVDIAWLQRRVDASGLVEPRVGMDSFPAIEV